MEHHTRQLSTTSLVVLLVALLATFALAQFAFFVAIGSVDVLLLPVVPLALLTLSRLPSAARANETMPLRLRLLLLALVLGCCPPAFAALSTAVSPTAPAGVARFLRAAVRLPMPNEQSSPLTVLLAALLALLAALRALVGIRFPKAQVSLPRSAFFRATIAPRAPPLS